MKLTDSNLKSIIIKYIGGTCTNSEKKILEEWLSEHPENEELLASLLNSENLEQDIVLYNLFNKEKAWKNISSRIDFNEKKVTKVYNLKFLYIASTILLVLGISFLFFKRFNTLKTENELTQLTEGKIRRDSLGDILPATTGAILVKSTGEKVALDDSFNIQKDGSIILDGTNVFQEEEQNQENSFYELIVPKAKIIHFTMFDGTKVWVNANSRLKFPRETFRNERRINLLSGEAYFEVAKYEGSKFFVDSKNGSIEVLGTKFNVNTSKNNFKTTLVEGRVKLTKDHNEEILTPNTSAYFIGDGFKVFKANLYADLAWKNNIFFFNNLSIHRIAKQIEDWYGVRVHIGRDVAESNSTYSGELRRDVPLTEVRKMLEFISGLDVKIEGNNLNIENE